MLIVLKSCHLVRLVLPVLLNIKQILYENVILICVVVVGIARSALVQKEGKQILWPIWLYDREDKYTCVKSYA